MNSTVELLVSRVWWIPGGSVRMGCFFPFPWGKGICRSIGFLLQVGRLSALIEDRFSEDLFVLFLIYSHKVKAHCRTEMQRSAIV